MGKPFGGMKTTGGGGAGAKSATSGFENFLANGINQGVFGGGNFGAAIDSMLQGNIGDPNSLNQYFANAGSGNGGVMPWEIDIGNTYSPPQFQGFDPQNPGAASANFNNPAWQNTGFQNLQLQNPSNFGVDPSVLNSGFGTTAQLGNAGSANVDGEFGQAVRSILGRESDKQVADLRARYGATGSGLGSNAQYAESNFRAESLPQIAAALGNINQQERGLNLQQRGQDLQNFYQGRGADISQMGQMLGNAGLGLQGFGQNNQAILGMNQLLGQQGLAQNQFNQGNAQFGSELGLRAQGMNMDSINAMNQLMQNQNQFQNSFNMNNAQNLSQNMRERDMFTANAALQNQQMKNQYGLGQAQVGLGLQGNQLNAQQVAMNAFMQMMMQNQGLNTAQRQQVYQPGWVQQGLGTVGQLAGIAGNFMNPMGGMGGAGGMGGMPQPSVTPMSGPAAGYGFGTSMAMPVLRAPALPPFIP